MRRLSFALAMLGMPILCAAGQRPHVIRGRVTTDSGVVLPAADVIVTIAPSAETIAEKSDSSGAFRVVIPKPTGEYILYISALGRRPFRQRVTIAASDSEAVVNAKLAPTVVSVAAVRVEARKSRPARSLSTDNTLGTDPTDKSVDGVTGALPPDLQGNLEAMAALIPGLSLTPNGVSAFGLGADANSTTLNGLSFGGSDLPRDLRAPTRFRTSPWDPTIGGFSGVQTATSIASGGNISRRTGHLTLDAPALQFSDPVASRLGQRYTNLALDEGGSGAYALDKLYYNFGFHLARQTSPVSSLADVDADALVRAGVSPDSAERLMALLGGLRVPVSANGIPRDRTTTTAMFVERLDRAAKPGPPTAPPGSTLAATFFGRYSQSEALSLSPTIAPGSSGKSTNGLGGVQGLYSRYFGHDGDYITETTSGLSVSTSHGAPYLALPSGSVLVASAEGLGSLGFGGNSALASDTRSWTWETINQTGFLLRGRASLPMKVYLQSRFDGYDQSVAANRLGRFTYASLADLANNQPSSFSRTLNAPERSGGEWIGAGAIGGNWIHNTLTLTGGMRVDANAFTAAPRYNPEIERLFGARTNYAPNSVDLSPRLGFTWRLPKSGGPSVSISNMSTVMKGAGSIRGGIGKFRGVPPPTLLADATSSTGLADGTRQLLCVGTAAPIPNWQSYAADASSIPSTCAGGATTFADTARSVTLFGAGYRPAESWRASFGWTGTDILEMYLAVDAAYSVNLHQPGAIDLNFSGTPRFTLPDEANRPVFVSPSSIVSSTGAISAVESRSSRAFGRVSERVSDLRSSSKQVTAYSIPNIPFNIGVLIFGYTWSDARSQTRGFDGSTAGDPRAVEWATSPFTPRHQFSVQLSRLFFGGAVGFSTAFRGSSGFTFTPTVAGDINGDGSSNDRAFVYDPATTRDTAISNGLGALMRSGPASARDCLATQVGHVAARNSCVGPWSATMNGNISFYRIPKSNNRMRVFLSLANIAGGVDQLLHGSDKLHGWGSFPFPEQTLYQVRGFDPTAQRFIYQVNPRFGASSPSVTTRRTPFRITVDVQMDLGRSTQEQQVEQNLRIRPSLTGTRASVDTIKARYLRSSFTDIYAVMLRFGDSLALSRSQFESIQREQAQLKARADSIYGVLATYLAALPDDFSRKEAVKRVTETSDAMWKVIYAETPFLLQTLTPGQVKLLPGSIREMVTTPNYKGRFFYGF